MKKILLSIATIVCGVSAAQVPVRLVSAENNRPVGYANISKDGVALVSSDSLGVFYLYEDQLQSSYKISAIGYKTIDSLLISGNRTIYMENSIIPLADVVLPTKTFRKKTKLGKLRRADAFMACTRDKIVSMSGKFFPNDFRETVFLDKVTFKALATQKNRTMAVALFTVGENGQPDEPIAYGNVVRHLKKGHRIVEVDLRDSNIAFPEKGIFVIIQYLLLEENRVYGKQSKEWYFYEPLIDIVTLKTAPDTWFFGKNGWQQNTLRSIAMQLTVTN